MQGSHIVGSWNNRIPDSGTWKDFEKWIDLPFIWMVIWLGSHNKVKIEIGLNSKTLSWYLLSEHLFNTYYRSDKPWFMGYKDI